MALAPFTVTLVALELVVQATVNLLPTRLIGHTLRVEYYESRLKVYLGREFLFELPRLRGDRGGLVDLPACDWTVAAQAGGLCRLPASTGALSEHVFRSAYDRLVNDHGGTTMAAVDRLVHHAIILEFNGESLRSGKEKEKRRDAVSAPAPSVPLRLCRYAPKAPFHRGGWKQP
jgi:hypothetical protein